MLNLQKLTAPFRFLSDPGHAWLEVPEAIVKRVGFRPSQFSYYDPKVKMLYLEEDCDAPRFMKAFEAEMGYAVTYEEFYSEETPVRKLGRCGF